MSKEEQEAKKRREKEEKERREADAKAKAVEEKRRAKREKRRKEKREEREQKKMERKSQQEHVPVSCNRKIIFLSCATRSGEATCRARVVRGVNILELKAGPMIPPVESTAAFWGTAPAPFVNECNYGTVRVRYPDQSSDLLEEQEVLEEKLEGAAGTGERKEDEGKAGDEGEAIEIQEGDEKDEDEDDEDDDSEDDDCEEDEDDYDQEVYSAPEPEVFANNVVAQKEMPVVLLGPVIGKVTETTAIIMIEMDCDAKISCTLTDIFSGRQHSASVEASGRRPCTLQFSGLDPGRRYRISLGRVRFRALGVNSCYGTVTTPDLRQATKKPGAEIGGDKRGRPRFRAFAVSGDDMLSLRFGEKNLWKVLHEHTTSTWASADVILHAGGQVNLSSVLEKGRELLEIYRNELEIDVVGTYVEAKLLDNKRAARARESADTAARGPLWNMTLGELRDFVRNAEGQSSTDGEVSKARKAAESKLSFIEERIMELMREVYVFVNRSFAQMVVAISCSRTPHNEGIVRHGPCLTFETS